MSDLRHGLQLLEYRLASRQLEDQFYADMRVRISSVLGDPEKVLGPDWTIKIAQRFKNADFACARAIIQRRPLPRYVGVLHERGEILAVKQGQWVVTATTMDRLLAHFLQVSVRARCGPDEVRLDQATGKIELLLQGVLLAELYAISPLSVSDYALDRAEAFLSEAAGLGRDEHRHEYLRAWLPLAHSWSLHNVPRIPSVAGWLRDARQLAGEHGVHDGTLALDEGLAAAILGAPWAMLSASRIAVAEVCGPWYFRRGDPRTGPLAIYSSPLHASAALLEDLSNGKLFPRSTLSLRVDDVHAGYPAMTFHDPWPDYGAGGVSDANEEASVGPCGAVNPSDNWTARAERALKMDNARAIELAFGVYWPRDERLRAYESYHGQRPLAQSGNWRFTVNATGRPKVLHAHRIDGTGRSVFQATVRTSFGYLLRFQHLKEYVLTASWMREPVAVIDGIDKSTAEVVSNVLGRSEEKVRYSTRALDLEGKRQLKSLIALMDEWHAAETPA